LVLLVGAGLFVQSFLRLRAVDPGFDPNGVVTMRLSLNARYDTPEKRIAFHDGLVKRVEAVPGVESVAYTTSPPLMGDRWITGVRIDGREFDMSNPDVAEYTVVSPDFFRTLDIQLVEGRSFVATDDASHDPVLMVNESFARYYWPGESALGKQVGMGRGGEDRYTIVGTVRDISRRALGQPADPEMHFSSLQRDVTDAVYVVRAGGEPGATIASMRGVVTELDRDVPLQFDTMSNAVAQSVTQPRFYTAVLASFATLALVLAAVGVYGVMSYSVGQRVREMGIRVALGATRRDVMGLVMGWSGVFVAVGVLAGLAGAYATSRLVGSLLYGVTATDALTFAVGAVVLVVVALAACYIPARRATGVDPVSVLR
jgi:putative ABC transport system permease protein